MKKRMQLKLGGLLSLDGSADGNSGGGLCIDVAKAQDQMESEFRETKIVAVSVPDQIIIKEDAIMNEIGNDNQ